MGRLLSRLKKLEKAFGVRKAGGWVTLDPSGTHVYVDEGKVTAGPSGLSGKPVSNLSPKKPKNKPAKPANKLPPKKPAEPEKPANNLSPTTPAATPASSASGAKPPKMELMGAGGGKFDHGKAENVFGKGNVSAEKIAQSIGILGDDKADMSVVTMPYGNAVRISVSGDGYHAVRGFERGKDGELICKNEEIEVDKDKQGSGIGLGILTRQIEALPKMGCHKISILAAGSKTQGKYIGYKVWPKFGYDGKLTEQHKQQVLMGTRNRKFLKAKTIQELYAMPGGREAWEEHGSGIELTLDLKPDSLSMKIFNEYLAKKKGAAKMLTRSVRKQQEDKPTDKGAEEPDLSPEDERAIDAVWEARTASNVNSKLISRLVRKATADQVLAAVREIGRGNYGLVSLAALGRKLGTTPQQLHAVVNQLRAAGKLTASGAEGRHGISEDERRWLMPESGSHDIGYVALRQ